MIIEETSPSPSPSPSVNEAATTLTRMEHDAPPAPVSKSPSPERRPVAEQRDEGLFKRAAEWASKQEDRDAAVRRRREAVASFEANGGMTWFPDLEVGGGGGDDDYDDGFTSTDDDDDDDDDDAPFGFLDGPERRRAAFWAKKRATSAKKERDGVQDAYKTSRVAAARAVTFPSPVEQVERIESRESPKKEEDVDDVPESPTKFDFDMPESPKKVEPPPDVFAFADVTPTQEIPDEDDVADDARSRGVESRLMKNVTQRKRASPSSYDPNAWADEVRPSREPGILHRRAKKTAKKTQMIQEKRTKTSAKSPGAAAATDKHRQPLMDVLRDNLLDAPAPRLRVRASACTTPPPKSAPARSPPRVAAAAAVASLRTTAASPDESSKVHTLQSITRAFASTVERLDELRESNVIDSDEFEAMKTTAMAWWTRMVESSESE
jgi:hypothetical protein